MSEVDFDSNKYKLRYEFFSETDEDNKVFCLPCQKVMLKSSRATHSKTRKHFDNCERGPVSQPIDTPSGRTDKVGIPKKSKKVVQPKIEKKVTKVKPTKKGKVEVEKKPKLEKKAPVKKKVVVVEQEVESEEESSEESESEESESDFSEDE